MAANRHRRRRVCGLAFGLALGSSALLAGAAGAGPANPRDDPPPTWRFRDPQRPVKVVVLAGSIGAWQRMPYAVHLERMCAKVEVQNLSKTGYGAWALKQRFRQQVLENPRVDLRNPEHQYWLVFQGGLNSVAMPETTNRHIRDVFVLAHAHGMRVVGLSLTPWGDDRDKRWRGVRGLEYLRHTRAIVDFVLGRSEPAQALGRHVARRADPEADWAPDELADIAIDLYDSPLRDAAAPVRDVEQMRAQLERDPEWKRAHARDEPDERARQLESDANEAARVPRWFMREQLRSFDHIHPNEDGHRLIAQTMCPRLPADWDCACPFSGDGTAGTRAPEPGLGPAALDPE